MAEGYYKKIKGKNYDRGLLELAESSVSGKGDGRISIKDAEKLLNQVKDNNAYTETEKRTMHYIRDNYKFTKEADSYFRKEIRSWAASKTHKPSKKKPSESISVSESYSSEPEQSIEEENSYRPSPVSSRQEESKPSSHKWIIPTVLIAVGILILFLSIPFLFKKKNADQPISTAKEVSTSQVTPESPKKETVKDKVEAPPTLVKQEAVKTEKSESESTKKTQTTEFTEEAIKDLKIQFELSGLRIKNGNRKKLKDIAGILKKNPGYKLKITGHTCDIGSEKSNLSLSKRRANVVKSQLVSYGVPKKSIITDGLGESSPVADNKTPDGKLKNRRVDFELIKN